MNNRVAINVLLTVVLLAVAFRAWNGASKLIVSAYPSDAKISFNGKIYTPGQTIKSYPHKFELNVSRPGFTPQNQSVDVGFGKAKAVSVVLQPDLNVIKQNTGSSPVTVDGLTLAPVLQTHDQQVAQENYDHSLKVDQLALVKANPIVLELPYITALFRIDYGPSQKAGASQNDIAIYVSLSPAANAKSQALLWLTSHGVNTSTQEIIYQ